MSSKKAVIDITRYKIISKIGEGSFSIVYRVKDIKTNNFYAAKVSKFMIDEETMDSQESRLLFREVNLMSLLNHPTVLQFVGYYPINFEEDPLPTIVTELAMNGSLDEIIKMESQGLSPDEWNATKKLINIYGIASGMSYLHEHNVLHRDLKPANILVDIYLHPKISDFGLSKITDFLSTSMNFQSQKGLKGTPAYMAPEIMSEEKYSKSSDVYAFGFIVYEILTNNKPFPNYDIYKLMKKIMNDGYRPSISEDVPNSYRELIERCWSQESKQRPSFEEIVNELKTNKEFITDAVDESEYLDYVEFIDNSASAFDVDKRTIHFSDFIKKQGRNKNIKPILFNESFQDNHQDDSSNNRDEKDQLIDDKLTRITHISNDNYDKDEGKKSINNTTEQKINEKDMIYTKINESETINTKIDESSTNENQQKIDENEAITTKINESLANENQQKVNEKNMISTKIDKNEAITTKIDESSTNENQQKINEKDMIPTKVNSCEVNSSKAKDIKVELIYPLEEFNKLTKNNQNLVEKAANDSEQQFLVGQFLIEGKNEFPKNINLGIQYIEESIRGQYANALVYYIKIHIQGKIVPEDLTKASEYLDKLNTTDDNSKYLLQGLLSYKKNRFSEAVSYFEEGSKFGNLECMYKCGKMYFLGEGVQKSNKESMKYLKNSSDYGYKKSGYFLSSLDSLNKIKSFSELPTETQMILISNNIKNNIKQQESQFSEIILHPKNTEKVYFNKSLKSTNFYECLKQYKDISIEIEYPSESFKLIIDLVIKIRNKQIKQLKIGIVFTLLQNPLPKKCFSNDISYHRIDSTIKIIPIDAFRHCSSLTRIEIPSSVSQIESNAFYDCSSLMQITIPPSVTRIGFSAFARCSSLTEITIPSSVTQIGNHTFSNCSSLMQITIPPSVTLIGGSAFYNCTSLTTITIPSSVIEIENGAFEKCINLKQITIPSSVTKFGSFIFKEVKSLEITGNLPKIFMHMFNFCSTLIQITIPSSVIQIDGYAFSDCSSLRQIIIPSSVTRIGQGAFIGCSSLSQITIPSSVIQIEGGVFNGCLALHQITFQEKYESEFKFYEDSFFLYKSNPKSGIFDTFLSYTSNAENIIIPTFITKIESSAFSNCSSLKQISIPSSVTQIGSSTFFKCSSLKQITLPSSITQIGFMAFYECSSLKQITIPSSVTKIGVEAFYGCSSLKQITIPSSVTHIGEKTFYNCSSLKEIKIPSLVTHIGRKAFYLCSSLKQITIPSSVTQIGEYAFGYCSSLTQITIPSSMTKIEYHAFCKCSSLKQLMIPSSLVTEKIGLSSKTKITRF